MIKKHLISLTLLPILLLSSCIAPKESSQTSPFSQMDEKIDSSISLGKPNPDKPNVKIQIPDEIWDVSDVNISYVDPTKKLIAFTFDDAPAKTLENILAVFASFNEENLDCKASATLFVNSYLCNEENMHALRVARTLQFELGNHTHSHKDLSLLNQEELLFEIERTDAILQTIDEKPFHLLRAPYGKLSDTVRAVAKTPIFDWTIDTLDWSGVSEEEIYNTVFDNRTDGAIVLMHDGHENTVKALKRLLPDLKKDGYQVVSISAMAKQHHCTLKRGSVYVRARKQI